jgi:MoxR-like ATPase
VHAAPEITRYLALLAEATRDHADLRLGISTRGSLALLRVAQAHAAIAGRHFVVPDDVKQTATAVLTHRLVPTARAEIRGATPAAILGEILDRVPVPALAPAR